MTWQRHGLDTVIAWQWHLRGLLQRHGFDMAMILQWYYNDMVITWRCCGNDVVVTKQWHMRRLIHSRFGMLHLLNSILFNFFIDWNRWSPSIQLSLLRLLRQGATWLYTRVSQYAKYLSIVSYNGRILFRASKVTNPLNEKYIKS